MHHPGSRRVVAVATRRRRCCVSESLNGRSRRAVTASQRRYVVSVTDSGSWTSRAARALRTTRATASPCHRFTPRTRGRPRRARRTVGVVGDIETPRRACTSRVSDLEGHRTVSARKCGPRTEAEDCLVRERAFEDGPKKVRDTRCPAGTRPRLCTSVDARMARPSRAVQSDHRFGTSPTGHLTPHSCLYPPRYVTSCAPAW